ncbi:platelet-activating factor acetylhydrolase, isoform II-domain-containing protein [Apodospora peruviana]|uniref:Putative phospholipase n=1 Tax=Apodospora peruviana TaxID=516989 RepID=A0AAE0M0F9_9PEZI|nr:platelet-activating factor acetylhydrolase, isoform II-domain-containing protein [Apodospora peruviana]
MKPFPEVPDRHSSSTAAGKIWSFLAPRLTVKYIVFSATALYFLYCFITWQPIFAHHLPKHTGQYAVGAVDIEAPASPARQIDTARFKSSKENAFELQTVLFTLYYPATRGRGRIDHGHRHPWIPAPLSLRAKGYARAAHISNWFTDNLFAGAIKALVGSITIPAEVDAPLSDRASHESKFATSWDKEEQPQEILAREHSGHPVVIFSHGTVSSRTDYSHYAGELAARGYVVALLEHRDGSCPGSVVKQNGKPDEIRLLFDEKEVETATGKEVAVEDFHKAQLSFREAEIEEAVRVIRMINEGRGEEVYKANPRNEGHDLANWAGRLNTDEMIVAGHSYGATGALQALRGGPTRKKPFHGAIILDPGKSSGPLNTDIRVPLLVVHSNSWSSHTSIFYGRAHFDTVEDIVRANNGRGNPSWFMTSLGTSHPSVTDAPLLEPFLLSFTTGATIDVYQGLRQYVHVANDFLAFLVDGEKRGLLAEKAEFPKYDPGTGLGMWKPAQGTNETTPKEKDSGSMEESEWWDWRSYWQIHVSPVI